MTSAFAPERLSVLLIDSSSHHRNLVAALLRGHGISKLRLAETAEEGFDVLPRFDPTLVITEWESDGIDGVWICRELRADPESAQRAIPVIVVTSRASRADVETARNAGVNEYIVKPVSAQAVLTRLQEVILRPRPFIESPGYVGPCRRRRKTLAYGGPLRRWTDPVAGFDAEAGRSQKEEARRAVRALVDVAGQAQPGDRGALQAVQAAVEGVRVCAESISDAYLVRAAGSFSRYLNGVGASPRLDLRVIVTHTDAMSQLIELPHASRDLRERVVAGLVAVVSKKLRGEADPPEMGELAAIMAGPAR